MQVALPFCLSYFNLSQTLQRKLWVIFLILFLFSCSGEKYDISDAVSILPERSEILNVDYKLQSTPLYFDDVEVYSGDFKKKRLLKLSNIISNFELHEGVVYFVNSNFEFVGVDIKTKKVVKKISLKQKSFLIKKRNITYVTFSIAKSNAVVTFNNGYVFGVDIENEALVWNADIQDSLFNKVSVLQNKVLILASSGNFYGFDLQSGLELFKTENIDTDGIGMIFNVNKNLDPIIINQFAILIGYYKTNISFFNIQNGVKIFTIPLIQNSLDFGRITFSPVLFQNLLIAGTSKNLSAISFANGVKIWELTFDLASNIMQVGEYIFILDGLSQNLLAINGKTGAVRWKEKLDFKDYTKASLFAGIEGNILLFTENGKVLKFKAANGEQVGSKPIKGFFSKNFDYKIIDNKIYYLDGSNNLIILL